MASIARSAQSSYMPVPETNIITTESGDAPETARTATVTGRTRIGVANAADAIVTTEHAQRIDGNGKLVYAPKSFDVVDLPDAWDIARPQRVNRGISFQDAYIVAKTYAATELSNLSLHDHALDVQKNMLNSIGASGTLTTIAHALTWLSTLFATTSWILLIWFALAGTGGVDMARNNAIISTCVAGAIFLMLIAIFCLSSFASKKAYYHLVASLAPSHIGIALKALFVTVIQMATVWVQYGWSFGGIDILLGGSIIALAFMVMIGDSFTNLVEHILLRVFMISHAKALGGTSSDNLSTAFIMGQLGSPFHSRAIDMKKDGTLKTLKAFSAAMTAAVKAVEADVPLYTFSATPALKGVANTTNPSANVTYVPIARGRY